MFTSPQAEQAVCELPFVDSSTPDHIDFWQVESTGHSERDVELGQHCAGLALDLARRFNLPVLLAMILRDITLTGKFTGIEAGFIASIASVARVGSHH
jgi:hypothetical protein